MSRPNPVSNKQFPHEKKNLGDMYIGGKNKILLLKYENYT